MFFCPLPLLGNGQGPQGSRYSKRFHSLTLEGHDLDISEAFFQILYGNAGEGEVRVGRKNSRSREEQPFDDLLVTGSEDVETRNIFVHQLRPEK